jgi:elongation of very long chain fatty acids protein 4
MSGAVKDASNGEKKVIKSVKSEDILCGGQKGVAEVKDEALFTSAILPPLYLMGAYLVLLRYMSDMLEADMKSNPGVDIFKNVWWFGPIGATVIYLSGVYFGMRFMKDRKEFQIKPYIFTYNLYQCILNLWTVLAMIHEVYTNPHFISIWGATPQIGSGGFRIAFLVWVHYINKYVELLDTLWMILRKKNNQVSFLHVYHHCLLIWAWFLVCKIETGGDVYFGACVNSFIHVIMYGYYTMALLNIPCPWKKWITNCQMMQFCACLAHSCHAYAVGNVGHILPLAQGFVMVNMLVLFGHFYIESYIKKGKKGDKET